MDQNVDDTDEAVIEDSFVILKVSTSDEENNDENRTKASIEQNYKFGLHTHNVDSKEIVSCESQSENGKSKQNHLYGHKSGGKKDVDDDGDDEDLKELDDYEIFTKKDLRSLPGFDSYDSKDGLLHTDNPDSEDHEFSKADSAKPTESLSGFTNDAEKSPSTEEILYSRNGDDTKKRMNGQNESDDECGNIDIKNENPDDIESDDDKIHGDLVSTTRDQFNADLPFHCTKNNYSDVETKEIEKSMADNNDIHDRYEEEGANATSGDAEKETEESKNDVTIAFQSSLKDANPDGTFILTAKVTGKPLDDYSSNPASDEVHQVRDDGDSKADDIEADTGGNVNKYSLIDEEQERITHEKDVSNTACSAKEVSIENDGRSRLTQDSGQGHHISRINITLSSKMVPEEERSIIEPAESELKESEEDKKDNTAEADNFQNKSNGVPFVLKSSSDKEIVSEKADTENKCMDATNEYGDVVKLLKVGKFYLLSVNGNKSKLPKVVNQDTNLRLENKDEDILLLTQTVCYKVKIKKEKVQLVDISRHYFGRRGDSLSGEINQESNDDTYDDNQQHKATEGQVQTAEKNAEEKDGHGQKTDERLQNTEEHKEVTEDQTEAIKNQVQVAVENDTFDDETDVKHKIIGSKQVDGTGGEDDEMDSKPKEGVLKEPRTDTTEKKGLSNTSNITNKQLKLDGDFGEIMLIRVGKFWLISFNGKKSKLPKAINQDPSLTLKVDNNDKLLMTNTCCYKLKLDQSNLTLVEYNSYFSRLSGIMSHDCTTKDNSSPTNFKHVVLEKNTEQANEEHMRQEEETSAEKKEHSVFSSDTLHTDTNETVGKDAGQINFNAEFIQKREENQIQEDETVDQNEGFRENPPTEYCGIEEHEIQNAALGSLIGENGQPNKYREISDSDKPKPEQRTEVPEDDFGPLKTKKYGETENGMSQKDESAPIQATSNIDSNEEDVEEITDLMNSMNLTEDDERMSPSHVPKEKEDVSREKTSSPSSEYRRICPDLSVFQQSEPNQENHEETPSTFFASSTMTTPVGLPEHFPWQKLLKRFKIESILSQRFNNILVEFTFYGDIATITIKGLPKDTKEVEEYIKKEIIEKVCKKEIRLSYRIMEVLQHTRLCEVLENYFDDQVLLQFENSKLFLYCLGEESSKKVIAKICTLVTETNVNLTGYWRTEDGIASLVAFQRENALVSPVNQCTLLAISGLKVTVEQVVKDVVTFQQSGKPRAHNQNAKQTPAPVITETTHRSKITLDSVWTQLAERFRIQESLENKYPAKVNFSIQPNKEQTCILTLTGTSEEDIDITKKGFYREYNDTLFCKQLSTKVKRMEVFNATDICTVLERRHSDVLILFQNGILWLYTFDHHRGHAVFDDIRKTIVDENVTAKGAWRNKESMHILVHNYSTYDGIYFLIDENTCSIYVAGLKVNVDKVVNDIVNRMTKDSPVRKRTAYDKLSLKKTDISNGTAFEVLKMDDTFIRKLEERYSVEITFDVSQHCFEIRGESPDLINCRQEVQEYCNAVISEMSDDINEDPGFLAKNDFQALLDDVAKENHVKIDRSFTKEKETVILYKDDDRDRKSFQFPNGHRLLILRQDENESGANYIIKVSIGSQDMRGFTRYHEQGQVIIKMVLPSFSHTDALHKTQSIIMKILKGAEKDNESVVDFKIPQLTAWSLHDMMSCWISAIYKYFTNVDRNTNPKCVVLSPLSPINLTQFVDCCKTQMDSMIHTLETEQPIRKPRFKISVIPGKLNEIEADVLVNTAAANLDLKQGAVSYALLTTAGPELQYEVRQKYRYLLKPGQMAITSGYRLKCKQVFHGALSRYDGNRIKEITKQFKHFLKTCLFKSNDYKAKSIAFPAIGTGNLRYPLDFVVREMFDTVKGFEESGYETSLQEVYFVVFTGDRPAVDAFQKREQVEKNQQSGAIGSRLPDGNPQRTSVSSSVLTVTGHRDNVRRARQKIRGQMMSRKKLQNTKSKDLQPISYSEAVKLPKVKLDTMAKPISLPDDVQNAFRCDTKEGLVIRVYEANILQLPVDCIVNPANNQLQHSAGLALAVAKTAGERLTRECDEYLRRRGSVSTGEAIKTPAGNLHYKCVIHAVGPCWSEYSPYTAERVTACQNDLKKAIVACLKVAEQNNMKTIAIPAVSSALFSVPKELCVVQYVKAVEVFSSSKSRHTGFLKEVHFVDVDKDIVRLIKQGFAEMVINKRPPPWDMRVYERKVPSVGQQTTLQHGEDQYSRLPYFDESGDTLTCKFTNARMVQITTGDIFRFNQAIAIVCSEDPSGNAAGGIAQLLTKSGGKQYTDEKKRKYNPRPQYGEVVTTLGGSTGFKWIMHAIMPHSMHFPNNEKAWKDALSRMIDKIFETAELQRYQSMVMSLLGTGAGNSDPKQCADILFERFELSCARYADTPFFLYIVNNDADKSRIVTSVFKTGISQYKRFQSTGAIPKQTDIRTTTKTKNSEIKKRSSAGPKETAVKGDTHCAICLDRQKVPKTLSCGHVFCTACIDKSLKVKAVCPTCSTICGVLKGDQPDGDMTIEKLEEKLPGYGCDTIKITYEIDRGKQGQNHPNPGKPYKGINRSAYLPNNKEGREVCMLLKLAFERRLVFTVGVSRTTGNEDVITWNDIHHKTDPRANNHFGYPDPGYFKRVKDELAAKGVKPDDPHLDKAMLGKLDRLSRLTIPVKHYQPSIVLSPKTTRV